MKNEKSRRPTAEPNRRKKTAAVVAAALVLSLILGICQGFLNVEKEESAALVPTAEEERGKSPAATEDEKKEKTPAAEEKTGGEIPKEKIAAEQKNTQDFPKDMPHTEENSRDQNQNNAAELQEYSKESAVENPKHEVGDILEDGSMYTRGDVEAGLDYIRENPQIWDQLVWH